MAAMNWAAIPDTLDLRLRYTISISKNDQPLFSDNGTSHGRNWRTISRRQGSMVAAGGQAKYTFDKDTVRMLGIDGDAFARLRYCLGAQQREQHRPGHHAGLHDR